MNNTIKALSDLIDAVIAFDAKQKAIEAALQPIYSSAYVHGAEYQGPTYSPEVEQVRDALATARSAILAAKQNGWRKWPSEKPDHDADYLVQDELTEIYVKPFDGENWQGERDVLYWMSLNDLPPLPEGEGK